MRPRLPGEGQLDRDPTIRGGRGCFRRAAGTDSGTLGLSVLKDGEYLAEGSKREGQAPCERKVPSQGTGGEVTFVRGRLRLCGS